MEKNKNNLKNRIISVVLATIIVFGTCAAIDRLLGFKSKGESNKSIEDPPGIVYDYNNPAPTRQKTIYPEDLKHFVVKGDNLIRICQKYNIDSTWYLLLAHYNHIEDPNFIRIDDLIFIPVEEKLVETSIQALNNGNPLLSQNYHVMKEGDRLNHLAKERYSNREHFDYALGYLNSIPNPNNIPVNTIIYLLSEAEMEQFYNAYSQNIENYRLQFENINSKSI